MTRAENILVQLQEAEWWDDGRDYKKDPIKGGKSYSGGTPGDPYAAGGGKGARLGTGKSAVGRGRTGWKGAKKHALDRDEWQAELKRRETGGVTPEIEDKIKKGEPLLPSEQDKLAIKKAQGTRSQPKKPLTKAQRMQAKADKRYKRRYGLD